MDVIRTPVCGAFFFFLVCVILLCGCKSQDGTAGAGVVGETKLACNFTVDTKAYSGRVSTQLFPATKEYSVLCQDKSEEGKLVQLVFRDEQSARMNRSFTIVADNPMGAEGAQEVSLSFDNVYSSREGRAGTVRVIEDSSSSSVEFDGVLLEKMSKETVHISGKIHF